MSDETFPFCYQHMLYDCSICAAAAVASEKWRKHHTCSFCKLAHPDTQYHDEFEDDLLCPDCHKFRLKLIENGERMWELLRQVAYYPKGSDTEEIRTLLEKIGFPNSD